MTYDQIMEVEDSLQMAHVFKCGFNGQPCHSDSYMTLVDYENLSSWLKSQPFGDLSDCLDYWQTNPNMQPPLRQVAAFIVRNRSQNSV